MLALHIRLRFKVFYNYCFYEHSLVACSWKACSFYVVSQEKEQVSAAPLLISCCPKKHIQVFFFLSPWTWMGSKCCPVPSFPSFPFGAFIGRWLSLWERRLSSLIPSFPPPTATSHAHSVSQFWLETYSRFMILWLYMLFRNGAHIKLSVSHQHHLFLELIVFFLLAYFYRFVFLVCVCVLYVLTVLSVFKYLPVVYIFSQAVPWFYQFPIRCSCFCRNLSHKPLACSPGLIALPARTHWCLLPLASGRAPHSPRPPHFLNLTSPFVLFYPSCSWTISSSGFSKKVHGSQRNKYLSLKLCASHLPTWLLERLCREFLVGIHFHSKFCPLFFLQNFGDIASVSPYLRDGCWKVSHYASFLFFVSDFIFFSGSWLKMCYPSFVKFHSEASQGGTFKIYCAGHSVGWPVQSRKPTLQLGGILLNYFVNDFFSCRCFTF